MIPYGRQNISEEDIQAVSDVLRSEYLTQGPVVSEFEEAVACYCRSSYAVAVNSGTSALHIACVALDVHVGDVVWTTPISFVASANCALYCGAQVDFVDIDPQTYNISVDALAAKLDHAERSARLPKVVVAVHLCGSPCDMKGIYALSQRFGFKIIEDASHAIGGSYNAEPIGSCRFSDITVFSFHPVKTITTAEGGMALTNDPKKAQRLRLLRSHGITRDSTEMPVPPDGPWSNLQIDLGFNYRLTDVQAALGISQLRRLDAFVAKRHDLATRYDYILSELPIVTPCRDPASRSGMHLYVIRLQLQRIERTHLEVFTALRTAGVGVNLHYMPIYRHPYYHRLGFEPDNWPEAERYYREAISLPLYPGLSHEQQDYVVTSLRQSLA